jgi:hypothetical protein
MNGVGRRVPAAVDTEPTDPAYWEAVLEKEGLAPITSLFADAAFAALDPKERAIADKIGSYEGEDCSAGSPSSLDQLKSLIQDILEEWGSSANAGLCIKTSCTTGDLKVVVYQKGVDGPRYHYNLRDVEGLTVGRLQAFLERRFQNLSVHIANT